MDETMKNTWAAWLNGLAPELQVSLRQYIAETTKQDHTIRIVRPDAQTYFDRFTDVPEYIDVWGVLPLLDALAWDHAILLKGFKGNGKSHAVVYWGAKRQKAPIIPVACTESTAEETTDGVPLIINKESIWELGQVPTAIEVANEVGGAVLLFEEINAMPAGSQKRLNEILDWRKSVTINCLNKTYYLDKNTKLAILMTMNPAGYSGTYDLNEDLKSRVIELELGYPAQADEKEIISGVCGVQVSAAPAVPRSIPLIRPEVCTEDTLNKILKFASETRTQVTGYALSVRDVIDMVRLVQKIGLTATLQLVLHRFEGEDRKVIAQRMAAEWGADTVRPLRRHWGAADAADA